MKENRILWDDGDVPTETCEIHRLDALPVDTDISALDIVEPLKEEYERGFS